MRKGSTRGDRKVSKTRGGQGSLRAPCAKAGERVPDNRMFFMYAPTRETRLDTRTHGPM